ncbi:hypothetical protein ABPG75_009112 [Micractinium tetrahymenae]
MTTLREALNGVFGGGEDLQFLTDVLKQYREVRKVYDYQYSEEDKAALQACATDLRPFTHSFLPGGALYWGLGKLVKNPRQLGGITRAALLLLRLGAAAEVFRMGYLVGSYKQGMDCTRRLVSLRSPLGGEIAEIIRARDPQHPLLKFERQPAELNEDGSRPRIVSEANRAAKIESLRRELAAAKAGQVVERANYRADERLHAILRQREAVLEEIHRGGGPTAAAAAGSADAMHPLPPRNLREEYEAAGLAGAAGAAGVSAVTGGGSLARVAGSRGSGGSSSGSVGTLVGGGLVITDQPPPRSLEAEAAEQLAALQAARGPQAQAGTAAAASAGEDPFSMLLGASSSSSNSSSSNSSGWELDEDASEDAKAAAAAEEARQRRRRQRRKDWWWRHSGRRDDAAVP